MFRYRVINEKRAEKSVDEISPTRWSSIPKSPISMTTRNCTKFSGDVIGTHLNVLAKFHLHYNDSFQVKR